jgi:hypothetical protein
MLLDIAALNKIEKFRFITYLPTFFDYEGEDSFVRGALELLVKNRLELTTDELRRTTFQEVAGRYCGLGDVLGLTSRIKLVDGSESDLFFIDFSCPLSDEYFLNVVRYLKSQQLSSGFVINSGNSYHFYSKNVFDYPIWANLLENARKSDLIGPKWPLFQLVRGYSVLRVSASDLKPEKPKVIAGLFSDDEIGQIQLPFDDNID